MVLLPSNSDGHPLGYVYYIRRRREKLNDRGRFCNLVANGNARYKSRIDPTINSNNKLVGTALSPHARQMTQLVRIAHHIQRTYHITLDFERGGLDRPFRCLHDDRWQAI